MGAAMKVVYILRNPGIVERTPPGLASAFVAAASDGRYAGDDLRHIAEADVLVVGLEPVGEPVFAAARRLRLVQRLGVGYDSVDLEAAARRGVAVCNLPDFNAGTVAEHAMMLILALLRRVFESTLLMKSGHWPLSSVVGQGIYDLQGRTLGILGFGSIGRELARRAGGFGVEILYHDRRASAEEPALRAQRVSLPDLLKGSDILSCHVPHTAETHHLIGRDELRQMKRTSLLVNTARGAVVDEEALAEALREKTIAGAGLDVFAEEPLSRTHPLRKCPNVLLTPHTAGQTREAMERMVEMTFENIRRIMEGKEPLHRVAHPGEQAP